MTKFESIGMGFQFEAYSAEAADRRFKISCDLCVNRGLKIRCDVCAIAWANDHIKKALKEADAMIVFR